MVRGSANGAVVQVQYKACGKTEEVGLMENEITCSWLILATKEVPGE